MAKAKTKSQRVREQLAKGKTVAEIVKSTGATAQLVYTIRAKMRKETGIASIAPKNKQSADDSGIATITVTHNEIKPCEWVEYPVVELTLWQKIKRFFGG